MPTSRSPKRPRSVGSFKVHVANVSAVDVVNVVGVMDAADGVKGADKACWLPYVKGPRVRWMRATCQRPPVHGHIPTILHMQMATYQLPFKYTPADS